MENRWSVYGGLCLRSRADFGTCVSAIYRLIGCGHKYLGCRWGRYIWGMKFVYLVNFRLIRR